MIAHADGDIADFLRGMQVLPLRPGALAALTASNYDKRFNTLTIGKDKHGQDRKMPLPDATAAFFAELTKGKIGAAPLLAQADGKVWDKDSWKGPVKAAVRAAGLLDAVSAYTMRHSVITDLVHAGTDTLTVAQLAGTSVLMIEKHYGHLTREHAREALARLAF
ncbi:tyrosine-type recombinase/integrase [Roseateles sp. GG27B]